MKFLARIFWNKLNILFKLLFLLVLGSIDLYIVILATNAIGVADGLINLAGASILVILLWFNITFFYRVAQQAIDSTIDLQDHESW